MWLKSIYPFLCHVGDRKKEGTLPKCIYGLPTEIALSQGSKHQASVIEEGKATGPGM